MLATNLGYKKTPATIVERPATEEQESILLENQQERLKLERDQSPNSIVGNFHMKQTGREEQDSIYEEKPDEQEVGQTSALPTLQKCATISDDDDKQAKLSH